MHSFSASNQPSQIRAAVGLLAVVLAVSASADHPYNTHGQASHYLDGYTGPTASGERYDPRANTAAHPSLPFGAFVRVTNLSSGRSVVVRINDRSPFAAGATIHVSLAAARELGILQGKVADVTMLELQSAATTRPPAGQDQNRYGVFKRLTPVSGNAARPGANYPPAQTHLAPRPGYADANGYAPNDGYSQSQPVLRVQFGAYRSPANAEFDLDRLRRFGIDATIVLNHSNSVPYRLVTSGAFFHHADAERWLDYVKSQRGFVYQDAYITR